MKQEMTIIWITFRFRCRTGFIPIYERGADGIRTLNNCHDPIIVTSTVGGRCLIPEHCDHLVIFLSFEQQGFFTNIT